MVKVELYSGKAMYRRNKPEKAWMVHTNNQELALSTIRNMIGMDGILVARKPEEEKEVK